MLISYCISLVRFTGGVFFFGLPVAHQSFAFHHQLHELSLTTGDHSLERERNQETD